MKDFNYKIENNIFWIFLNKVGSEIDYNNIDDLSEIFKKAEEKKYNTIFFDCKNLRFLDSSGLGRLITASKKFKITLKNVSEEILKIFKITNVTAFFNFE